MKLNFIVLIFIFIISSCNVIKTLTQKDANIDTAFFSGRLVAFEVFEIAVQDQEKIVTLSYSGENTPISCSVSNTVNSYVSTPCSCHLGVCQVGITGNTGFYGMAYADYTISDEFSSTSNSKINLDIDFVCQSNWTRVPANSNLGIHNDFCVMTYEAKNNGYESAISSPDTTPWVDITANNAKTKCTNLGSNYDLIWI